MPFALLIIGVWLLIAGVRNTAGPASQPGTLFYLLQNDFTGPNNFAYWFIAIILIGAIGYIPKLKPISTAFLTLVVVVLFLKRGDSNGVGGGFFSQFLAGIGQTQSGGSSAASSATVQLASLTGQLGNVQTQAQNANQTDTNSILAEITATEQRIANLGR